MPAEHVKMCIEGACENLHAIPQACWQSGNGQPDVSYGGEALEGRSSKTKVAQGMGSGHGSTRLPVVPSHHNTTATLDSMPFAEATTACTVQRKLLRVFNCCI